MLLSSMPELSGLAKGEKKAVIRASRRKRLRHWQFWLSLVFVSVAVLLIANAAGTLVFMVYVLTRFDLQIFLVMFLLPCCAAILLIYVSAKIDEFVIAPHALQLVRDQHPTAVTTTADEQVNLQKQRKKKIYIGITCAAALLAIAGIRIYSPAPYKPRPMPAALETPRIEINKIGLTKRAGLQEQGLGKITDIVRIARSKGTMATHAIAGTKGAVLVDDGLRNLKHITFSGKADPVSVVRFNEAGDLGYYSRGSWCSRPYLMNGNGEVVWTYDGGDGGVDDMAAGDINGDDRPEYVVGFNGGGGVHLLDSSGHKVWTQSDGNVWHVEVIDIGDNGRRIIIHSNAAGAITIRDSTGRVISKHTTETYFSHFSMIDWPADKGKPRLLQNSDENIWILDLNGRTIKKLPSPFSCDGHAKGAIVRLDKSAGYLGVIVDSYLWDRSVLYVYDKSDNLVYQEILPDACFAIAAHTLPGDRNQTLLVGCKDEVLQYKLKE